jgi:hypothetical protein
MKCLLVLTMVFAFTAAAADISGTWKGTAETQNGTFERTFVFKVDGNKLTGETSSERMGKSTIMDGKVEGDNISFTIKAKFQDNEMTLHYSGKVSGNEMTLKVDSSGGFNLEYKVKKIS